MNSLINHLGNKRKASDGSVEGVPSDIRDRGAYGVADDF
jgi:hypothetical protein